jgi:hypothetical protein
MQSAVFQFLLPLFIWSFISVLGILDVSNAEEGSGLGTSVELELRVVWLKFLMEIDKCVPKPRRFGGSSNKI